MNMEYGKGGGTVLAIQQSSKGEKVFDVFNYLFMLILCITTLYPFMFLLSTSLASADTPLTQIHFLPSSISLENYKRVFTNKMIGVGYYNTLLRTIIGSGLALLATLTLAYPLSKRYFPHRSFWTLIVVFTMFFSGGLIPTYLLVRNLHLMNTTWALVLPELISAFNLVIVRNYMM